MGTTGPQPVAPTTPRCLQKKRPIYYLMSGASIKMSHVTNTDADCSSNQTHKTIVMYPLRQLALFVKADSWRVVLTLGDQHTEDAARGIPGSLTEPSRVL